MLDNSGLSLHSAAYEHQGYASGAVQWANSGQGKIVGTGWQDYVQIISGGNGVVYGITPRGELNWYKHEGYANGDVRWSNGGNPVVVGSGWQNFLTVISMGDGVLYGVTPDGKLDWYRHEGFSDGTVKWANGGNGIIVGIGWHQFKYIAAGRAGVIYGVLPSGSLEWYRHDGFGSGAVNWANSGQGKLVGTAWDQFHGIIPTDNGIIYALKPNGDLDWYKHDGHGTGAADWANSGTGVTVGTGWVAY